MVADRLVDIFSLMAKHGVDDSGVPSLCSVAAEITGLDGAGISLTSRGDEMTTLCVSNDVARTLMDLEMTLREGPAFDAGVTGTPVENVDLSAPSAQRWTKYSPQAAASGAGAVFGFPVRIGAAGFGALSLYRSSPGHLSAAQASDAYLVASVIARAVLAIQAGSPLDDLSDELRVSPVLDFRVHQAAGMVSVQGSTSVKSALVLIRAHAFAESIALADLAEQIVSRATRYDRVLDAWLVASNPETSS